MKSLQDFIRRSAVSSSSLPEFIKEQDSAKVDSALRDQSCSLYKHAIRARSGSRRKRQLWSGVGVLQGIGTRLCKLCFLRIAAISVDRSKFPPSEPSTIVCIDVTGPLLPFIGDAFAAVRLHRTGHSCFAQHFSRVRVGSAGLFRPSLHLCQ